jgi:predicted AAA+ superfamily ATPase
MKRFRMMIERTITPCLLSLFKQYPAVTITGPRQSGKTTLCRAAFPDLAWVSLESPDTREFAVNDPRGFLRRYSDGAILDEIQRAPELVSYLQEYLDDQRRNSRFVLTGSQQFRISETVSQSLAGRTALLRLFPFSIAEALLLKPDLDTESMLYAGFYPRIYDRDLNPTQALGDYFETYVERDGRQLSEIRNLSGFQRFVRLCAGRVGQLLNLHGLGSDAGVSHTTARQWLSVLEASYIVFLLPPYHPNLSKRLIKSPKLYFYDVGLASYLLGVENQRQLLTHPLRGNLLENVVVIEALKHRYHQGKRSNLHFYRDSAGHEIDLIYTQTDRFLAIEIKAGETVNEQFFSSLGKLRQLVPEQIAAELLVYGGQSTYKRKQIYVTNPLRFTQTLQELEKEQA